MLGCPCFLSSGRGASLRGEVAEGGTFVIRVVVFTIAVWAIVLCMGESSSAQSPRYGLYDRAEVLEVYSPNIIKLRLKKRGKVVHVRLLGVGSPRNRDRIRTLDAGIRHYIESNDIWNESRNYVRSLLRSRLLEVWARKWNRFDEKRRLLVYLVAPNFRDQQLDVNGEIIRKGLGFVTRDYVHVTYAEYKRLENEAKRNRRGIWKALPTQRLSSLNQ